MTRAGERWQDEATGPEWLLRVTADSPRQTAYAEALLHLGNGRQGLRISADVDDPHSDVGFFARDVYDTGVGVDREIVNLPHPLGLRVRHGYERMRPSGPARRVLDMRDGVAHVDTVLTDEAGNRLTLSTRTAVHATRPSLGVMVGALRVPRGMSTLALDLFWDNTRGNAYLGGAVPELSMNHTVVESVTRQDGTLKLDCRLAGTGERVRLESAGRCDRVVRRLPLQEFRRWGQTLVIDTDFDGQEEVVAFELVWKVGGESADGEEPARFTAQELLAEHRTQWRRRWAAHDIVIAGDAAAQEAVRFCLFHLLQHELPTGRGRITPARGLSGCYHSGATFFDTELHKDAFWAWTVPEVAASHLTFRHDHLPQAREFAERTGFAGARFPEATNDAGRENGPHQLFDYPEHRDITEWSVREVLHNSADVAYAVHRYHAVTGDTAFLVGKGAELVLETARFAASVFEWDDGKQAHVIRSVMGPDEYHYHVDNNYFTNSMLRWNLTYALSLIDGAQGVASQEVAVPARRIGLTRDEIRRWRAVVDSVFLPPPLEGRVPAQHEGYASLPDCPPRGRTQGPAARLSEEEKELAADLLPFPTKLVKQADIVLLTHLLPDAFDDDTVRRAFDYYEPRTAHESSLSAAPHGVVAARLGRGEAGREFLLSAARYNLDYHPREDYRNGLHLSAYAGAWQILVEGFLGARAVDQDTLALRPGVPDSWQGLTVPLTYRGRRLIVAVLEGRLTVTCLSGPPLSIRVGGTVHEVKVVTDRFGQGVAVALT